MSSEKLPRPLAGLAAEDFRRACGRFATGVTIASVLDASDTPHGLTVSSFAAVSLDPPLVLICLGHEVTSIEIFRAAKYFGINVLGEDQRALSERFARKGHDRFDGLDWQPGETGVPLLDGVLAQMECAVTQRVTAGDHDIFVAEMVNAKVHKGDPLIHFSSRYRKLADPPVDEGSMHTDDEERLVIQPQGKPKYTLDELLAQCDSEAAITGEERAWLDAQSLGREL